MLLDLPYDLLRLVLDLIPNKNDLSNLADALKGSPEQICDLVNLYLCQELVLSTGFTEPRILASETPSRCLQHVRSVKLQATNINYSCNDLYLKLKDFSNLLTRLDDECLLSFRLSSAACTSVPPELFGPEGYLSTRQTSLRHLSFNMARECMHRPPSEGKLDFTAFKSLTDLSWCGLATAPEVEAFATVLRANSRNLISLQVGIQTILELYLDDNCYVHGEEAEYQSIFPLLLGLLPSCKAPYNVPLEFPALQALTLHEVPLERQTAGITRVLNLSQLRSFAAFHCDGTGRLLQAFVNSNRPIRLESLTIEERDPDEAQRIIPFLRAFTGLKRLYLCLYKECCMTEFLQAAAGHSETLTHVAYHYIRGFRRELPRDDVSYHVGPEQDSIGHPFSPFNLKYLGLWTCNSDLDYLIRPFASKNTLTILHIRATKMLTVLFGSTDRFANRDDMDMRSSAEMYREERNRVIPFRVDSDPSSVDCFRCRVRFHNFANWAFGPSGIRSLRLICLNEGAFDYTSSMNALLLCRNRRPSRMEDGVHRFYRRVSVRDIDIWELIDEHSDDLRSHSI